MSKIKLTAKELRSFYTITKLKNKIKTMEEHNRGLKKRLKAMQKASENNHNGMMYWKNEYIEASTNQVTGFGVI